MNKRLLLLPGDGIGPEVIAQAEKVLRTLVTAGDLPCIDITTGLIGGCAIDMHGTPLPDDTLAMAQHADAVLLGAVGAPQYDNLPNDKKPELGLLSLRQAMGVFANLRPAICHSALVHSSSLKPDLVAGLDILIVRELIGGIYFGQPRGIIEENGERVGINTMRYAEHEIIRLGRAAFAAARRRQGRLCSVEKANVLEVGMLWRDVMTVLGRDEFPDIELSHMYADNAAMQLVRAPKQFDVIATGNLFGDVLSDAAAMLTGSIGMLPSASLDDKGRGLYEPVHGSAPDIAGQDKANPLAAILSVEMMLRYSLNASVAADKVSAAVRQTLNDNYRTADIAGDGDSIIGCAAMGQKVLDYL
ncbi:3-isopropylmalate dehydrogenase [Candidatus Persebacteraceae bacterium Df01]|jgi:3-isopropylmalate dehydrogenase|uniref:3-isopropylmalate dehydrogenase n=1 Tax=Candidatus Doriopsillibacter californiensis TaxID=2970740 RepID=A0ABT7QNA2_9GAMM|nr:3-isopropylmalate dehydrogenase [Candidatus Persebacteraceae bacterium Df01]